jgi:hypothetical protein
LLGHVLTDLPDLYLDDCAGWPVVFLLSESGQFLVDTVDGIGFNSFFEAVWW